MDFWMATLREDGLLWLAALLLTGYPLVATAFRRWPRLPLFWLTIYAWGRALARMADRAGRLSGMASGIRTALAIALSWAVIRLVFFVLVELRRRIRGRPEMARLTRDCALSAGYAMAALVLLRVHGNANLAGILTTSAVLTAVIGLAMQTTLSNLIAGVALQLEHPFGIGDWICVGEHEGKVIGISWKSTRLLNRERQMVYLPNSMVIASAFRVLTQPDPDYIVKFNIGLHYDVPPSRVSEVILEVVRRQPAVRLQPPPEVRLKSFGDFSIGYEVRFALADPDCQNRLIADIHRELWYAFRRAGIRIPYPIRDVHLAHEERRRAAAESAERTRGVAGTLRRLDLLSALSDAQIERIAGEAPCVVYGAGETIVRAGEPGTSLFVVIEGACEVRVPGRAEPVAEVAAGDCFGEMSLLTGEPRNATVLARTDTRVIEIGKELFAAVLQANPDVAARLAERLERRRNAAPGGMRTAPEAPGGLLSRIRRFFKLSSA